MVFRWSLSDRNSPQVSRTLLCNLADLNNAAVWMVYTRHLIFKSSNTSTNPLRLVSPLLSCPIVFSSSIVKSRYLSLFPLFSFTLWSAGTESPQFGRFSFFVVDYHRSDRLAEIRWSVCISNLQRCASHFLRQILGCAYTIYAYDQI